MSRIISLILSILVAILFSAIPAIPGAVLWWYLKPVMFWEKFAWIVTSMVLYVMILAYIVYFISDRICREEDEEETVDENEE